MDMQMTAENSLTYDFSRFDRRANEKIVTKKKDATAKTKTVSRSRPIISGFSVFSSIIVFAMLVALLYSYVHLTEASDINRRREAELANLREEVQMLEVSRNQRMGDLKVRDWAVTRLGMSKIDKSQITYVSTSNGDKFELAEKEKKAPSGIVAGFAKGFSTIIEYIN